MVSIYVLELSDNKYYIGKTTNLSFRLSTHFHYRGSAWTTKYRPLKIIELIKNCDAYDEDKYTLQYMAKYGINNVRGGTFCRINLTAAQKKMIQSMINGSENKCYKCGSNDHYVSKCPFVEVCDSCEAEGECYSDCDSSDETEVEVCGVRNSIDSIDSIDLRDSSDSSDSSDSDFCYRCGRKGHYSNKCYAIKHIKGYFLK
jgi:cellular nucleic acid-binding protein